MLLFSRKVVDLVPVPPDMHQNLYKLNPYKFKVFFVNFNTDQAVLTMHWTALASGFPPKIIFKSENEIGFCSNDFLDKLYSKLSSNRQICVEVSVNDLININALVNLNCL